MKLQKYQIISAATIVWLLFMIFLSHQDGQGTARASELFMKMFCFLNPEQVMIVSGWTRKGAHVFCFMILTILLLETLCLVNYSRYIWIGVTALCILSFLDEYTKRVVPGRHYSTFDVMLNLVGVIFGLLVWKGWTNMLKNPPHTE